MHVSRQRPTGPGCRANIPQANLPLTLNARVACRVRVTRQLGDVLHLIVASVATAALGALIGASMASLPLGRGWPVMARMRCWYAGHQLSLTLVISKRSARSSAPLPKRFEPLASAVEAPQEVVLKLDVRRRHQPEPFGGVSCL